ncbi:hypothetical protein R3P38DRAFT_3209667 [Favolaschia claudopus]|uniref:Uncharacterized protein n=1 Tax=Favolaschia claudopus TaxID=2862362 RepID=A0AAW0AI04_9AGAR
MASHSLPKVCDDCCCKRCSRRRNHQVVLPGNTAPKSSANPTLFILDNDERDPFRAALTPLNIPELLNECLAYYHSSPGDLALKTAEVIEKLRQRQPTPALAHILAQPMLCALYFTSYRYSFPSFNVCWKHCSPNVRHLEIDTNFPSYKTTGSATLQLESLRLGLSMGILEHVHPLHYSDFYPFDLSKLKALSIYLQLPVCWNNLIRCETIKVLELYGGRRAQDQDITKRLDISTFTSLTTLRIITSQTVSADIIDACASIVTSQPIRSITIALDGIVFGSQIAGYRKLDSTLSSLPLFPYPDIEFAVRVRDVVDLSNWFPCLSSRNRVLRALRPDNIYCGEMQRIWWRNVVSKGL